MSPPQPGGRDLRTVFRRESKVRSPPPKLTHTAAPHHRLLDRISIVSCHRIRAWGSESKFPSSPKSDCPSPAPAAAIGSVPRLLFLLSSTGAAHTLLVPAPLEIESFTRGDVENLQRQRPETVIVSGHIENPQGLQEKRNPFGPSPLLRFWGLAAQQELEARKADATRPLTYVTSSRRRENPLQVRHRRGRRCLCSTCRLPYEGWSERKLLHARVISALPRCPHHPLPAARGGAACCRPAPCAACSRRLRARQQVETADGLRGWMA